MTLDDGDETPWPVHELLTVLVEAAEHLLNDHSCDGHGHERVIEACRHAKKLLAARESDPR